MNRKIYFLAIISLLTSISVWGQGYPESSTGWVKYENNPVLGGNMFGVDMGTCFPDLVLHEKGVFRMYFSWRSRNNSLAYTESADGINWSEPVIFFEPNPDTNWEEGINRTSIVKKDGVYHLWYTGQSYEKEPRGHSWIGYATSADGIHFERYSDKPIMESSEQWEGVALMHPHTLWDEKEKVFKMWYSAGENYEPNAIGYAVSKDGIHWQRHPDNPIFVADKNNKWEQHKVTACQVIKHKGWYLMFYIGFEDENLARIGLARSKDGVTNWERLQTNPIISPAPSSAAGKSPGQETGTNTWDASACYKPWVVFDKKKDQWYLWYNGRNRSLERIGLVIHKGEDLGFPKKSEK